jgi:hypothetical protein
VEREFHSGTDVVGMARKAFHARKKDAAKKLQMQQNCEEKVWQPERCPGTIESNARCEDWVHQPSHIRRKDEFD